MKSLEKPSSTSYCQTEDVDDCPQHQQALDAQDRLLDLAKLKCVEATEEIKGWMDGLTTECQSRLNHFHRRSPVL